MARGRALGPLITVVKGEPHPDNPTLRLLTLYCGHVVTKRKPVVGGDYARARCTFCPDPRGPENADG